MRSQFCNEPIKFGIREQRVHHRSKFGFFVFSHARVRPLTHSMLAGVAL
jgi:hypothetical protein